MSGSDHSTQIERCIDRLRSGDLKARDELLAHAAGRLNRLTRKMLKDYPGVHRWEQTDDVIQNAALRLCRAVAELQPQTAANFFRLAAVQIRRELVDLARRHSGPMGLAQTTPAWRRLAPSPRPRWRSTPSTGATTPIGSPTGPTFIAKSRPCRRKNAKRSTCSSTRG